VDTEKMIEIKFYGWLIPALITLFCFGYALFIHKDESGMMSGLGNILLLVPAGIFSTIAWIVYATLK
jgi:EamA domain-containing membrane protein RarD